MESYTEMGRTSSFNGEKDSIEEDFYHGVTVAQAHVKIRLGFIRKVYGILGAQLLLTTCMSALFMSSEPVKQFVQGSPQLVFVGMLASIGLLIALAVKRKEMPMNMYLLAAFTMCEAYTVGTVVTFYDKAIVLQAFGLTLTTVISLTVYTFQSKRDFSSWGAGLFSVLWILILAGFLKMFISSDAFEFGVAVFGAVLFSGFIVYDTHMLMHKLSPEEYILAAINLYLDIVNLFLEILRILNSSRHN